MDWFLYDKDLRHEKVNFNYLIFWNVKLPYYIKKLRFFFLLYFSFQLEQ